MTLRPASASWFELLTSREELGATLDCLAGTGAVQLEAYSRAEQRLALPDLRATLAEYETLARRYGHYWPNAVDLRHAAARDLLEAPRDALERVRGWAKEADPLIAELEELAQSAEDIALLTQLQALSGDGLARLDQVAHAGPVLAGRVYLLPDGGLAWSRGRRGCGGMPGGSARSSRRAAGKSPRVGGARGPSSMR